MWEDGGDGLEDNGGDAIETAVDTAEKFDEMEDRPEVCPGWKTLAGGSGGGGMV